MGGLKNFGQLGVASAVVARAWKLQFNLFLELWFSRRKMADDIVDTIAQYDLDEDFPPYANDQNKELNQIVREKVRLVAQLGLEIEEHQERLKILEEHLKSVKMELVHT